MNEIHRMCEKAIVIRVPKPLITGFATSFMFQYSNSSYELLTLHIISLACTFTDNDTLAQLGSILRVPVRPQPATAAQYQQLINSDQHSNLIGNNVSIRKLSSIHVFEISLHNLLPFIFTSCAQKLTGTK